MFFLSVLELIGTAAFAVSGAITAIRKEMDLLGICLMGIITACGGGVFRDLLLGSVPPVLFTRPVYAITAIAASLITFIPAIRTSPFLQAHHLDRIVFLADAIGLGIFSTVGVRAVQSAGYGEHFFFSITLGVITGVGGGVLRDILAGDRPYIFVKHIYACAALAGALVYYFAGRFLSVFPAMILGSLVTLMIRILAARYRWSLPKAR
ncbi:MAG: TRIC cation channel family protein [Clostridia bacterium]|nr:TRIC cation channel family protein [Clostridia bacterium]